MAKGKRGRPKGSGNKKKTVGAPAAAKVKRGRGRPKGSKNKKTLMAEGIPVVGPFKGTGKRGRPARVAQGIVGNGIRIVDGMALINLTGSKVNRILVIGSDAKTPVTHL